MAIDYGEKEREFLDSLREDTGHDLAGWMDAITAQDLPHRNDIIDWLRHQGFLFAQASWLERIHHNGGRPIYGDSAAANLMATRLPRERAVPRPEPEPGMAGAANDDVPPDPLPPRAPPPAAARPVAATAPPVTATASTEDDLSSLLAKAKAYRPLAQHLITKIRSARPAARFLARTSALAIADPDEFAVLAISGKDLRLYLPLGDEDGADIVKKATSPPALSPSALGKSEKLTHMIVLTDARQIDQRLLDVVARAAAKVNGG